MIIKIVLTVAKALHGQRFPMSHLFHSRCLVVEVGRFLGEVEVGAEGRREERN